MENYDFRLRCAYCGKFVSFDTKQRFIVFGTYGNSEPKEEEFICDQCAKKLQNKIKTIKDLPRYYWEMPLYVIEAAKELGAVFDWENYKWKTINSDSALWAGRKE